jgi:hypothetical protein
MGDGAVVYAMQYDPADGCWKIDEFVQELPQGWGRGKHARRIRELTRIPAAIGRDN